MARLVGLELGRVLDVLLEGLEPRRTRRAIDHAVVGGEGDGHDRLDDEGVCRRVRPVVIAVASACTPPLVRPQHIADVGQQFAKQHAEKMHAASATLIIFWWAYERRAGSIEAMLRILHETSAPAIVDESASNSEKQPAESELSQSDMLATMDQDQEYEGGDGSASGGRVASEEEVMGNV